MPSDAANVKELRTILISSICLLPTRPSLQRSWIHPVATGYSRPFHYISFRFQTDIACATSIPGSLAQDTMQQTNTKAPSGEKLKDAMATMSSNFKVQPVRAPVSRQTRSCQRHLSIFARRVFATSACVARVERTAASERILNGKNSMDDVTLAARQTKCA